LKSKLQEQ